MAHTISERLHAAIRKINRPGSFCVTGSDRAANPGLEVVGLGPIGLPLIASQASTLKTHCKQAPYGKGEKTLVDTSVRRVWQLDPDRFSLTNPEWPQFLRDMVKTVQRDLGLDKQKLDAHLYNLLLYEPGSFFLPHRDGERLDRMVATLVVVLPSSFTGGELVVRHEGEERVIDFGSPEFNQFHTHFAAFYADCDHEVRPLRSGYRLCLVYNLTLARAKKGISAPRTAEHIEDVARVLRGWSADDPTHKLVVPLGHQYTQDGLAWDALKGVDRVKARVLHEAAKLADGQAHLARLTFWESSAVEGTDGGWGYRGRYDDEDDEDDEDGSDDYEVIEVLDSSLTLDHWSDAGGDRPKFGEMAVEEDEVVPRESPTKVKPEQDVSGYTGNEGLTMERWYRHAAVVLWPNARHFDVLCDCGMPAAIESLRQLVGRWRKAAKPDPATRGQCVEFATTVLARCAGTHCGDAEANDLLGTLTDLGEPELVRAFLCDVVAGSRGIRPGKAVRAACETFGWATFRKELTGLFTATAVDPVTRVAGPSADQLERNLGLLEAVCVTRSRRKGDDGERIRLCTGLAGAFASGLESLDAAAATSHDWRLRNVDRSAVLRGLTRSLLATGQLELFSKVINRVLADTKLYPLAAHITALTDLRPWLRTHLTARCEGVSRWVAACRAQLEALTAREPAPPGDLRREANIDCRCADCAELRRFLGDPAAGAHRFRAAQDRRSHLEHVIRNRGCDVDCTTERAGSPHVLVCTKNTASFQARLRKYHEDCRHLATLRAIEQALPT
ncbi:MAG TPA: 2OG-Fe(II) oxygenase [Fimbriiglobus sp.]|nr:2OG-Fe(II) oxygenase [Fimbriiglobus sp.]